MTTIYIVDSKQAMADKEKTKFVLCSHVHNQGEFWHLSELASYPGLVPLTGAQQERSLV